MKQKVLSFYLILFIQTLQAQPTKQLYFGLYTAGYIEQYSAIITAPYYRNLNYYTLSFRPKIGYQYNNITVGAIGSYTFHTNTFQNLEPTWGIGYFGKYHFGKTNMKNIPIKWLKQPIPIKWFAEWRHTFDNGYYESIPDWRRIKRVTSTNSMVLQVGGDVFFGKCFSLGLSAGIGYTDFFKDANQPELGKKYKMTPHSTLTFQYHLNL
jgi:hypothetical protein